MSLSNIFRPKSRPKIFICYRRGGEGAGFGGRIADKLIKHFGTHQCFRDIENIEKGTDFVESIKHATGICEVLIVVIGPDWTTMKDENGRTRLDDINDFVRLEVSTALERNIRVIPVLVGGAKMPTENQLPDNLKSLQRRQSHELSDLRWDYDSDQLIKAIESIGIKGMSPKEQEARKRKQKIIGAVALTAVVILLGVGVWSQFNSQPDINDKKIERPNNAIDQPIDVVNNTNSLDVKDIPEKRKNNFNRERENVKNAIRLAANLEIEVLRTLNPGILQKVMIGDALRNSNATLDQFRTMGVHQICNLESQSFGDIDVYEEGNRLFAEAELFETWSNHTHRTSDNLCLLHQEPHESHQTIYLEQKNDSWFISSIAQNSDLMPITTQCGQYE